MKKITLIFGSLLLVILSIYNINSALVQRTSPFAISNIVPFAKADGESSQNIWLSTSITTMSIINDYTTTLGCIAGKMKQCLVTRTTTTVTCQPMPSGGGNSTSCVAGTSFYDYTQCSECF
jgi:hypothetical protein